MKKKTTIITLFAIVFLFSPLTQAEESANDVLRETKVLYKKADQLQGAWTTTGKLIKQTEDELKKGNKTTALKLAKKAKKEAVMSIAQAEQQATQWAEPLYIER